MLISKCFVRLETEIGKTQSQLPPIPSRARLFFEVGFMFDAVQQISMLRPRSAGRFVWHVAGLCFAIATVISSVAIAVEEPVRLTRPLSHQVIQRTGFVPRLAYPHAIGGPQRGAATVTIEGEFPAEANEQFEFRVQPLLGADGAATDWAALVVTRGENGSFTSTATVAAGGWYRLEVRQRQGEAVVRSAGVEPFGVGELFLIAGQSYAAGYNDELQKVVDPLERVVAYDRLNKTWQVAHDPQPHVGEGGTIWPPLGDALVPLWHVPIGMVNVAVSATSSRQWLPETELHANLAAAGRELGNFRAVLWQQGESDVIEKVTTETYVKNLTSIRSSLATEWKFQPPWLLAKSTLHPQVYNNPVGEQQIRAAIEQLAGMPGFRPGPDTDILDGENRGGPDSRQHFSRLGQRRAAQLWFAAVWQEFNGTGPNVPNAVPDGTKQVAPK